MAASNLSVLTRTIRATGALTAHRAVTYAGVVPAAAAACAGFSQSTVASGALAPVDALGTTIAESGAAIAVGAALELDASGRVITRSAGVTVGRACAAAAGSGEFIEIMLIPN